MLTLHMRFPISIKSKHFYYPNQITTRNNVQYPFPAARRDLVIKHDNQEYLDQGAKGEVVVPVTGDLKDASGQSLPVELRRELMPMHVAVVMDGNGRWAKQRGWPTGAGHEAGVRPLKEILELCFQWGIRVLTVFSMSTWNWRRHKAEIDSLLGVIEKGFNEELDEFLRKGIRVSTIGDSSRLPKSLRSRLSELEEKTRQNSQLHFIVAINYCGKYDITQACKSIAHNVKEGVVQLEDINETLIEEKLETNCAQFPCPDLLIRTGGDLRISNFLLWQLAFTELFFTPVLWPDFGKAEFIEALTSFQQRERRYGGRC